MMSELVQVSRRDGVLIAAVNNPPVNALSPGVPEGLIAAVREAAADEGVHAVVIIGTGRTFIAGADIREFARIVSGEAPPLNLAELLDEVEGSAKPVIMAIHGSALGGGLETAMAGHYRVAVASAQVGQPEVKLGLIPGAGGTQRLPRLVGGGQAGGRDAAAAAAGGRGAGDADVRFRRASEGGGRAGIRDHRQAGRGGSAGGRAGVCRGTARGAAYQRVAGHASGFRPDRSAGRAVSG